MKRYLIITLLLVTISASAQPFKKEFMPTTITMNDGTQQNGFLKWSTHQNNRVSFKPGDSKEVTKYSPAEIAAFQVDSLHYQSLFNVEIYADDYPLLGKTTKMKQAFARVIHQGPINVYFITYYGVEPVSGAGLFLNYVFEKNKDGKKEYASFPILMRMRDKKYENAKEKLYAFFEGHAQVIEGIKQYQQQEDFTPVIDIIRQIN
jgi:hypothetical protein